MLRKIPKTPILGLIYSTVTLFKIPEHGLCGQVPHTGNPLGAPDKAYKRGPSILTALTVDFVIERDTRRKSEETLYFRA